MDSNANPGLSFWERETFFKEVDYVIIGSGIVGLNAAIHMKERVPNAHVIILEKGMLPTGASTRNAGFACFGSISELLDDLEHLPENEVLALVEKRWKGLQRLQQLTGVQLKYDECGGYELFTRRDIGSYIQCMEALESFNEKLEPIIGEKTIYENADDCISHFGFRGVNHIIVNKAEGHIDTGGMMKALLAQAHERGVHIYNGADVDSLDDDGLHIHVELRDGRKIKGRKCLIATNGFTHRLLSSLDLTPARNQVLITRPIPDLKIKGTFHYDKGYYYFRNVGNRILFGGGRNLSPKNEETDQFGTTPLIRKGLLRMLDEIILPNTTYEIDMWWSGILGVGQVKKPIIKYISDNLAVSVRMGGMGVAIGSLVGIEGADLLLK